MCCGNGGRMSEKQPKKKKTAGDVVLTVVLIAAICVFCYAGYNLFHIYPIFPLPERERFLKQLQEIIKK